MKSGQDLHCLQFHLHYFMVELVRFNFRVFTTISLGIPIIRLLLVFTAISWNSSVPRRLDNLDILFVCFDALRPSKQLWSCRDVTSKFMGLLPGIEMK